MTWSVESVFVRAHSAVASKIQTVLDMVAVVAELTRPNRSVVCECGVCCRNRAAAEWLADKEAEEDVAEPTDVWDCRTNEELDHLMRGAGLLVEAANYDPSVDTSMCDCGHQVRYCECPINEEPPLTDDELVAVRGLIQERYLDAVGPCRDSADGPAGVDTAIPPQVCPPAGTPRDDAWARGPW